MSLVGHLVFLDGICVGKVEKEFFRSWSPRKGALQSVQVSGMDVQWKRTRLPGCLYWEEKQKRWKNKLRPDAMYSVRRPRKVQFCL